VPHVAHVLLCPLLRVCRSMRGSTYWQGAREVGMLDKPIVKFQQEQCLLKYLGTEAGRSRFCP